MQKSIDQLKKDWFISPSLRKNSYSYFAVRHCILVAVEELKIIISGKVLDLGCGIMPYREYLLENENVLDYKGVDLPPTEYHNTVKPDAFWDGKRIPFEDESFDWVIATEFLEHYFDTNSILVEINRVLKPGGKFFFTVPCIWPLHEVPFDEYRFTPYSLEKHFAKASFSNIKIKALGGFNMSLAIMLGLWLDFYPHSRYRKYLLKAFLGPFFKILIRKDNKKINFKNHEMASGLYGFIQK